jgi:uncharacterized protein VirK/YbjX
MLQSEFAPYQFTSLPYINLLRGGNVIMTHRRSFTPHKSMPNTRHSGSDIPVKQSDFKDKAKLVAGSVIHPVQTYRWRRYVNDHPPLDKLATTFPHLITRIHGPYLTARLKCRERVDVLIGHYEVMFASDFGSFVKKAANHPITVCEFTGKSGALYQLKLSTIDAHRRDGELILRLISKDICIYTVAFTFITLNGERYVKIGGLQGLLAVDDVMRIKRVTRDIYGCRPKDLMVSLVREIGNYFECKKMLLAGNENKLTLPNKRVCRKSSDYDQTWKELNALKRDDGDFELPCISVLQGGAGNMFDILSAQPVQRATMVRSILLAIRTGLNKEKSTTRYIFSGNPTVAEVERDDYKRTYNLGATEDIKRY